MDSIAVSELLRRLSRLEKRAAVVEHYVRDHIRVIPGGGQRAKEFDEELETATMPAPPSPDEDAPGDAN